MCEAAIERLGGSAESAAGGHLNTCRRSAHAPMPHSLIRSVTTSIPAEHSRGVHAPGRCQNCSYHGLEPTRSAQPKCRPTLPSSCTHLGALLAVRLQPRSLELAFPHHSRQGEEQRQPCLNMLSMQGSWLLVGRSSLACGATVPPGFITSLAAACRAMQLAADTSTCTGDGCALSN